MRVPLNGLEGDWSLPSGCLSTSVIDCCGQGFQRSSQGVFLFLDLVCTRDGHGPAKGPKLIMDWGLTSGL